MKSKLHVLNKLCVYFSCLLIILNFLLPIGIVLAEDSTPSAEISIVPTPEPTIISTEAPTPTPDLLPTPSDTPTPASTIEPSAAPIEILIPSSDATPTPTEEIDGQPNAPPSNSPSPTLSPSPEAISASKLTVLPSHLSATIIRNNTAPTAKLILDVNPSNQVGSATLITDKADYFPTDEVIISGSGFKQNAVYTLVISSNDLPAVNFEDKVTINSSGSFIYTYQLDGILRQNYQVFVKDDKGQILAQTAFTDPGLANPKLYTDSAHTNEDYQFAAGDTVYAKAQGISAGKYYKFEVKNSTTSKQISSCQAYSASGNFDSYITSVSDVTRSTSLTYYSYEYTSSANCDSNTSPAAKSVAFNVAKATIYSDSGLSIQKNIFNAGSLVYIVVEGLDQSSNNWSTTWILPSGSSACVNTSGTDRPESSANGTLPSIVPAYLQYPPSAAADNWNKPANYNGVCPVLSSSNEGQWKLKLDGTSVSVTLPIFTLDTTAPVIESHSNLTVEATSASGVTVAYAAPNATDNIDADAPAICSPVSGSTFALGDTTATCSKTDTAGNTAAPTTFKVTVQDTTPPVISFNDRTAPNANGWNNTNATVNWNCSDSGSGAVSSTVSQTLTNEGANQLSTGTCTDNAGNSASDTQTGINIDKTAPATPVITTPAQSVNTNTIHIIGTAEVDSTVAITGGANTATGTATGGNYDIIVTLTHNGVNNLSVAAKDIADNISSTAAVAITHDDTAPTVVKLGNASADVVLSTGDTSLIFSEVLSDSSKTTVANALSAGADKTLTYDWSGAVLAIHAAETTTFANDVVVSSISDLTGNSTANMLIIDSKLADTQTTPDGSGGATANSATPQVVLTNPTQGVNVTITSGTADPTIDASSFITNGTGSIPQITINSDNADISIPATAVTGPADWNGIISAPIVTTVTLPETSGETKTLGTAIEIGFAADKLSFANAVRILLPNQAGKRAGFTRPGTDFTEITNICADDNQAAGDLLAADSECKIDVGLDLVIWTKHFTKFATYTQTTNSSSSGGGNSSGSDGGDGLGCASHDCSIHPLIALQTQISNPATSTTGFQNNVLGALIDNTTLFSEQSASSDSASITPSPTTGEVKGIASETSNNWWLWFLGVLGLIFLFWFFKRRSS